MTRPETPKPLGGIPVFPMGKDAATLMDQIDQATGLHDHSMQRNRPYNGQIHTDTGLRGQTEIKGITFRDLRDAFVRAVLLSTGAETIKGINMRPRYEEACKGENACLSAGDLYGFDLDQLDPMAISNNLSVEVEKLMGIFPNLPPGTPTADEILKSMMPPEADKEV